MRNKPPTKAQKRNTMSTYLKNMAGYKHNQLKNKSFDDIHKLFDKAIKRVNTFIDMDTELVEGSEVRAEGNDKETTELQRLIEVVPDKEEVAIDAIPLATKPPSIVDWKIHKEGKKSYYQIIRADGSSKMYLVFSHMLKCFDREDLETLYKLVTAKYRSTRLVKDLDLILYGDLKTMFNPLVEDQVWKNQSDYRVLDWKLYDSCGGRIVGIKRLHDVLEVTATKGRHKNLEMSYTSRKSVAPARNRILVYPDSDEEDEEYCSLPPLLPCFQTPHPCAIINSVHNSSYNEFAIDNMTIEEYARYQLTMLTMKSEIQEDSSLDEILDDLFKIGAENLRKMEHEIPNRYDDITNYVDSNKEDGELRDLPTFPATNEFASDSEKVEKNIDIAEEKEDIPMKDIEMDENQDIDHLGFEKPLQLSFAEEPFLVVTELNDQSSFLLHTIPSSISNERSLNLFLVCLCRRLNQHAHTLHHLESLLTISLDRLDILKEDLFEHEHVVINPTLLERGCNTVICRLKESHGQDSLWSSPLPQIPSPPPSPLSLWSSPTPPPWSSPTPPPSPLSLWSSPLPQIPSPPLPPILSPPLLVSSPPPASPIRSLGYRAAMIRLRAKALSTSHSPWPHIILSHTRANTPPSGTLPSGTPPLLPIPLPTSSTPLYLLSTDRRVDRLEVTLPPRKRLGITLSSRYEVGESSSTPTARPLGGIWVDYGFVATMDREIMRDLERDVGYRITDTWDEMLVDMLGAPATDDTKLGRRMIEFTTRVRQDTDKIYTRLDD
ncbi:hypothetical protein Tco_0597641 [Tanacetum coccineum]